MITTQKPLTCLTAEDLMSRDVTTISQEMSLREAARLLLREHITGAPVVDTNGRCVGVLSATDFVRWTEQSTDADSFPDPARPTAGARSGSIRGGTPVSRRDCYCSDWQIADLDLLPDDAVRWYMTPDPVMVSPAAPIADLARIMIDAHIHRVIVAGENRRPIGIVSTTDILGAVASAAAEPNPVPVP